MKRFMLQAKKSTGKTRLGEWLRVEEADTREELEAMIPEGGESRFRIVKLPIDPVLPADFPEIITKVFEETGLAKYKFERHCGISPAMLGKMMRGEHVPTFEPVLKISKALGIPLERLYGYDRG